MSHKNAVTPRPCGGSIPIVPFRYALMPKNQDDESEYYYKECKAKLDQSFDKLSTAAYTLRTLRPGYIYLYDEERATTYLWETDGTGNYSALQWTSLGDYGKTSNKSGPMPNITVCDDAKTVWIAYTQHLWTKTTIEKYIAKKENRKKCMTKLDVEEILNGSGQDSTQENVLPSGSPERWIEEYKTPSDYKTQFGWSSHPEPGIIAIKSLKAQALQYAKMHQPKLPVFMVLYDSVATAMDLSNIATMYTHQLSNIKNQQKGEQATESLPNPVPVEMKLDATQLKSLSVEFHRKKILSDLMDSILASTYPEDLEHYTALAKQTLKYSRGAQNPRIVGDLEARMYTLSNAHINPGAEHITEHLKVKELMVFRQECDEENVRMESILADILKVTEDHKTVLLTMEVSSATHPRNIASTLNTYDRDNPFSATALELTIAESIQGIGIPVPGKADVDERFKLLIKWAEDENSPLFTGVQAFNPFKDKIDSVASTLAGLGDTATELHKMFPYALGTEIIVNEITAYSFRKVNGATRWNKAKSVVRNVNEALQGTSLQKLFKALQGRYGINKEQYIKIGQTAAVSNGSETYMKIINLSEGDQVSRSLSIQGTRTTTITDTITTTKTRMNGLSKTIGEIKSLGIPAGVAWMHSINLISAIREFSRNDSLGNSLNLGSALFGFVGAFNEAGITALQSRTLGTLTVKIVGHEVKVAALRVLANSTWRKFLGYGGAALEAMVHGHDAWSLGSKGDNDAAIWAGTAAVSLAAGGVIITATLTGAAASSTIPVAGWIAAGVLLIVAGIAAIYMKIISTDTALGVWASRTVFGVHRRDLLGFGDVTDTPFNNLSEELQGYYNTVFSPVKLDEAEDILGEGAETTWDEHGWNDDEAKFVFLLPAYKEGLSRWSYRLDNYDEDDVDTAEDRAEATLLQKDMQASHATKLKDEGLYVFLNKVFSNSSAESATLDISYWPNGYGEDAVKTTLYVDE